MSAKPQSQLGMCTVEPDCWALLPAALDQACWSWIKRLLFLWFSLSIQRQGHSQGRKGSAWKWRGLWFSVAPHKLHLLSKLNSLVKASWMCCGPYLHSVSTCLLCITVPQMPSCKGKLYQHSPPFNLCLRMDHSVHTEYKPSGAH